MVNMNMNMHMAMTMSIARHPSEYAYEYDHDYECDYEQSLDICPLALVAWPSAQLLTWLVGWLLGWLRPRPPCRRQTMNMNMHLNRI